MADNPFSMFDSATPSSGGSAPAPAQKTQTTGSANENPFSMFDTPKEGALKASSGPSKEDQEYESKVQSLMPKARQFIETSKDPLARGTIGATIEGLGKPFEWVGGKTAVRGISAALGAGEGKNFSERYNQLKAEDEAVNRAYEENHAFAKGAGELAGVVGTSLLAPGLAVAAPVEAAAIARGVGPTAAKIAGMGAEGAAWGAGTATGEQAFGSKSKQDEPGIVNSALVGGATGAGLGLVGKGVSSAYGNYAPEWVKGALSKDYQTKTFSQKWLQDIENGSAKMDMAEYKKALDNGQPVSLLDVGGDSTQEWLRKAFKGRGQALDEFQLKASQRLEGEGERFDAFLQKYAGTDGSINQNQIRQAAKDYAEKINDANYQRAAWQPENGKGSWKDSWMTHFDDPDVAGAFGDAVSTMKRKYGDEFTSPLSAAGEAPIDSLLGKGLDKKAVQQLKNAGIETVGDIAGKTEAELLEAISVSPKSDSHQAQTAAKRQTQKLADSVMSATKGIDPEAGVINPELVNVEFLDRWQRALNYRAESLAKNRPELNMDFVKRLQDLRGDIVGSLKNPKSSLYNEAFDTAHTQAAQFHRENDAFSAGQELLRRLSNGEKASEIANTTAGMTGQEKEFFTKGILGQMVEQGLQGGSDGRGIKYQTLKNWLSNPHVNTAMNNTLGEAQFTNLRAFLKAEVAMGDAARIANTYGKTNTDYRGFLPYMLFGGLEHYLTSLGGFVSPFAMAAYQAADYYAGRKFATSLAEKMMTQDPKMIEEAIDSIQKNPKMSAYFSQVLGKALPSMVGAMSGSPPVQRHAAGGAVHMQDGGVPPRELDERGMYSEGAETARRILPKAQGSGPEFIQRLLGKGVRPDELHHTRIGGIPLRHMGTGELHPAVQGQIGGHELADLIHNNAPKMDRINRNDWSRDYKPTYTSRSLKLNAAKDYSELNVAKQTNPNQEVFSPPAKDFTVIPQLTGFSAYARQNAKNVSNSTFMPIDDLSERYSSIWDNQKNRGIGTYGRTHDRFGNYQGLIPVDEDINSENFAEKRPALQQAAQKVALNKFKKNVIPTMEHFTDVPNLAYHARMSDIPLQKNGKTVSNLNIEEAQSDAARRYDRSQRGNKNTPNIIGYDPATHKKMYEEAAAAQERLRASDEPFYKTGIDHKIIDDYDAYLQKLSGGNDAVPDVPYIESNKSWQRALAKDVLRKAASSGYESITVTPWEEQVRRARHSVPVDKLYISSLPPKQWSNSPQLFAISGYPIHMEMDDLKKIYGDRIETLIRNHIPEGQRGHAVLPSDPYGKKPFYAFLPNEVDIDPDDNDEVQNFIANAINGGKATRRKAEVHNAFIKQLQNVINEEHDPHFKIDYSHSDKHEHPDHLFEGSDRSKVVAPGAFLSPELRDSIFKKGFKRFKKGGYVTDNLTHPIDPAKGYAFGGSANQMRMVNKSIHMPKPGDEDFVGPTMSTSSYDPNKSGAFDKLNMFGERNIHWTPDLGHAASRGYRVDKTGRTMRSTGGRIPDADKLFKSAKKYVDSHTKHLLDVPDDAIVKALRVAQKKV